jgi:serine protease
MLGPIFEGFSIWVREPLDEADVQSVLGSVFGVGWEVSPFGDRTDNLSTGFDLTSSSQRLSVGEAWDLSYRLRELPGVIHAEPLFEAALSGRPDWYQDVTPEMLTSERIESAIDLGAKLCGSGPDFHHLKESDPPEWSIELMKVPSAWQRFFPDGGKSPGEGVVIGHPDTGFQPNPEILPNLLVDKGFDFLDMDPDATDPLEEKPPGVLIPNPGHGTGTSSVIISPRGDQTPSKENENFVSGVAPGASVMPLRITKSVVLFGMMKLAKSIDYAVENGAHAISISLGGVPSLRLWWSIVNAQRQGVIVAAAAGNCVQFVVWPAAYDEVIGVAACNAKREIWIGSSRGEGVDVTAPGESVWHATAKRNVGNGEVVFGVDRGNGTSFAVTAIAGIAALWLSYHGRDKLIEKYGLGNIPQIFKQVLQVSCDPFTGSGSGQFGAGLINAEKVLATPLPERVETLASSTDLVENGLHNGGDIKIFHHLFEKDLLRGQKEEGENMVDTDVLLEKQLAEVLRLQENQLPGMIQEFGQELLYHFSTNPTLYKDFCLALLNQRKDYLYENETNREFEYQKQVEKFPEKLENISQKFRMALNDKKT